MIVELLLTLLGTAVVVLAVRHSRRAPVDTSPEGVRARGGHTYRLPGGTHGAAPDDERNERLADRELAMDIWARRVIDSPDVHQPLWRDPRK